VLVTGGAGFVGATLVRQLVAFGNVYGPWCARKRGVLNAFFGALRSGEPLVIYGQTGP
jgi:nucleoside-diphosphate-sugar epimerase